MGAGIVGFEVDFGSTPNFFEVTSGDFDFGDCSVTTLMGDLVLGAPIGGTANPGVRPYASGGIGLLRTNINAGDSSTTSAPTLFTPKVGLARPLG